MTAAGFWPSRCRSALRQRARWSFRSAGGEDRACAFSWSARSFLLAAADSGCAAAPDRARPPANRRAASAARPGARLIASPQLPDRHQRARRPLVERAGPVAPEVEGDIGEAKLGPQLQDGPPHRRVDRAHEVVAVELQARDAVVEADPQLAEAEGAQPVLEAVDPAKPLRRD